MFFPKNMVTSIGLKGLTFSPLYAIFPVRANYTVRSDIANHAKLSANWKRGSR